MSHWLSVAFSTYVLHVEHANGYQWWSGAGSDLSYLAAALTTLGALARHHNCHVHRCWRLQWRQTAAGDLVCRHHHPEDPKSHGQVLADHIEAKERP